MIDNFDVRWRQVLGELRQLHPDWRFGQLVANVSFRAKGPTSEAIWGVEDDEFLRAAEEHLAGHAARQVASAREAG